MFFLIFWIMEGFDSNPIDSFFLGVLAACGISVLRDLMRLYYFTQTCSDCETESEQRPSSPGEPFSGNWKRLVQFWCLAVLLSQIGPRVSSLIVLEFSLRALSAWASAGLDADDRGLELLLIQCQFSLGCGLSCTVSFLHQGAPHSSLCLLLAAALSWALAGRCHSLWSHVARLYPLHSTERNCGKCIQLLDSGHSILAALQRAVVLAFFLASAASATTVYDHFLSQKDTLKFWIPLMLCYTILLAYIQEEQRRRMGIEVLFHNAVLRLGALLVLLLTVGHWSDVLQVLITFLGEAVCLMPSKDLLQVMFKAEEGTTLNKYALSQRRKRNQMGKLSSSL